MEQSKTRTYAISLQRDISFLFGQWKEMFSPTTIPKDIWAGVTVALVALPLNLALAIAAGVAPGVGITTGIVASVIGAVFGGQKYAVTGPAAAMAVVLIEIGKAYGLNAIWLVGMLAGLLQLLSGALRLGGLISFLPMPVIVGFANAIGALVFFNAVDDFLGLPAHSIAQAGQPIISHPLIPDFIEDLLHIWYRCLVHNEANLMAIAIGSISFALAYFTPKVTKAIPGQLVAILATTVVSVLFGFKIPVIRDIAAIPNVMPAPMIPQLPFNDLVVLFPFVLTVYMLGSIESLLSASVADGMTGSSRHRPNQELIGQGLANIVVPFFGGIPVTGVIARTAVNIRSGAKTRLSPIVHSVVLAALIFFLAKYAEQIPLSALAAILMLTGIRLVEWDAIREIWKGSKMETFVSLATTIIALSIDLTAGVFAGLFFACALFIKNMSDVKITPPEQEPELMQNLPTCNYVRTFVVDGPLFFGAAERFIESLVEVDVAKVVILHVKNARVMDLTASQHYCPYKVN